MLNVDFSNPMTDSANISVVHSSNPTQKKRDIVVINMNQVGLDWQNTKAAEAVHKLTQRFGAPSAVDPQIGGQAVWKKNKLMNLPVERVEVHDVAVPACKPTQHLAFVKVSINIDIPPSRFLDVTSLSGTLSYQPLSKLLTCMSGSFNACVAILALATQIAEGNMSLDYAQSNDLLTQWLISTSDPKRVARLIDLIRFNLTHTRGNRDSEGYWPMAHPQRCRN
jgi:hypothetical protein